MTDNALIPTGPSALDRLRKTTERTKLDEFVAAKTRRSILLIDVSSSMRDHTLKQERKIDALRKVVTDLKQTHTVPMVAFGRTVELVEAIPEPSGMTPLARAIDFATMQEANHIVLVTDGEPDPPQSASFEAAERFGGPIDVFYIGDPGTSGAAFCAELARRTGGTCGLTDLTGAPKQLAGKIVALLGDGSAC